jgi:hypothetical protein
VNNIDTAKRDQLGIYNRPGISTHRVVKTRPVGAQGGINEAVNIFTHKGMSQGGLKPITQLSRSLFAKRSKARQLGV